MHFLSIVEYSSTEKYVLKAKNFQIEESLPRISISSSWFAAESFVDVNVVGGRYVGAAVDAFFSFTARKYSLCILFNCKKNFIRKIS